MINFKTLIQNLKRESPVDKPLVIGMIIGLPCIFFIPINIWLRVVLWLIFSVMLITFFLWKWELFEMLRVHVYAAKDIKVARKKQKEMRKNE